jgi:AcrR family transcriptional regulator
VRKVGRPQAPTDLREQILEVSLRLMGDGRSENEVTIDRIVDEVGCTPPTLYHYWANRELLLAEASARGWERFRTSQRISPEALPLDRLRARGRAYLDFAVAHPKLFGTLFLTRSPQPVNDASLGDLVADVAEAMDAGSMRPGDPQQVALALWAAVHGVAALAYTNPTFGEHGAQATLSLLTDELLAARPVSG